MLHLVIEKAPTVVFHLSVLGQIPEIPRLSGLTIMCYFNYICVSEVTMKKCVCLSIGLVTLLSLVSAQVNNSTEHTTPNHPHYRTTPDSDSIPPVCDESSKDYNATLCKQECAKEANVGKPFCHENHPAAATTVPSATTSHPNGQSTTPKQEPTTHHPSSSAATTTTSLSLAAIALAVYFCSD